MKNILNDTELTGLQKLTQEQLINIILRKDDIERKLSDEVRKQKETNIQLTELIEEIDCLMKY
ncbi:MAG: hypothetical protein PUH39_08630 [Bacteroidales bacterium]|nr:hypothetical protein [Bacteroidales bacterium]